MTATGQLTFQTMGDLGLSRVGCSLIPSKIEPPLGRLNVKGLRECRSPTHEAAYFFMPESRWFFMYIARSASLTCPNIIGAAGPAFVAAAGGGADFAPFFAAKAPDVETARTARPTRSIFFILKLPRSLDAN